MMLPCHWLRVNIRLRAILRVSVGFVIIKSVRTKAAGQHNVRAWMNGAGNLIIATAIGMLKLPAGGAAATNVRSMPAQGVAVDCAGTALSSAASCAISGDLAAAVRRQQIGLEHSAGKLALSVPQEQPLGGMASRDLCRAREEHETSCIQRHAGGHFHNRGCGDDLGRASWSRADGY